MRAMSIDSRVHSNPLRRRLRNLLPGERLEEAMRFLDQYHWENGLSDESRLKRRQVVQRALARRGWYDHTPDELAFGARVAWRNSATCVGRLFWKSLEVLDCRDLTEPDQMAAAMMEHLRLVNRANRVPSVISVFAPVRGRTTPAYVENGQLVQYAGYTKSSGVTIGDPKTVELTRTALALGWRPADGEHAFNVLPVIIHDATGARSAYCLPADCYREVHLHHPHEPRLKNLGLRWYAVPVVSDMILTIGGIDYPCAPFNGHYVATEIASRNLVDPFRYDLIETIGEALGVDRSDRLWKDVVLTELNRAVLHTFEDDKISICDHHTAAEWFVAFTQNEHAAGRRTSADWAWIVPPQAAAACPTFHLEMTDRREVPNFYRSRAADGASLGINYDAESAGRNIQRLRSWRRWLRWKLRERLT